MTKNAKFCPQCGTPRASDGARFCSSCGESLELVNNSEISFPLARLNHENLTADQQIVLKAFEDELAAFVTEYQISSVEIEDLENLDVDPQYVFSKVEYYASGGIQIDGEYKDYSTDEMLTAGLEAGAISVYLGKLPYKKGVPSQTFPYTTIIFDCYECEGEGCSDCDDEGRIIYSASWDENGCSFSRD